jgi:predicted metalloenzyme YecM
MSDFFLHPAGPTDAPGKTALDTIPAFVASLLEALAAHGIDASAMPLSHVCWRVETLGEYHAMRTQVLPFCAAVAEDTFNGRPISMLSLRQPVAAGGGTVDLIELPAPREAHVYRSGWEHVGFVAGDVEAFHARHAGVLTGIKDRGTDVQAPFITVPEVGTVKFYRRPLREIVERDGWRFEAVP